MRILHVRDVANVGSTLVAGLRELGHEAVLRDLPSRGARLPLPLRLTFFPARLWEAVSATRGARQYDIVHLHVAYMGWLGMLGRYPYFLHGHGMDLQANLAKPVIRWFTVQSMKRARRFYYSTPDLRAFASPVRPDAQFLPNPIDTRKLRPLPRTESGPPRVLLLSRFEHKKGPDIALAMARALRRREPVVEIDAFNWGPLVSELADPEVVRLIATVPYREMPELLSRYDLLLGQFRLGILSMMELEAMACGKPLVSYFTYPEVYDEPPPLYSTADPEEGSAFAASLLGDAAARRRAGERGRAWVEAHHNFIQVARTLEGHYRAALGGQPVSHARADSDASLSA